MTCLLNASTPTSHFRWKFGALRLVISLSISAAQMPAVSTQAAPPLLSPQAAYDQASLPVDITRRDVNNWSDIEIASLDAAVAQGKESCLARSTETYAGSDLVAYARLCALGKQWQLTYLAATTYINERDLAKPLLADAYSFEIQADLNLTHEKAAVGACFAMLRSVPYGPITDGVTTETVRYLQFAYLPDALDLLTQRQPYLLTLLRAAPLPNSAHEPSAQASIPVPTLYEHALQLAMLQQFNAQPERAAAAAADIDQALPSPLPPDEAIQIAGDRRQYALLGTHLRSLPGAISILSSNGNVLAEPHFGEATIFLLFPRWCAQCIRQAQEIVPAMMNAALRSGSNEKLHVYALLADQVPASPIPSKSSAHTSPVMTRRPPPQSAQGDVNLGRAKLSDAVEELRRTPSLIVAPSTLADFNASDFPFLIATDHDGIIRLMVPGAPNNALKQNGPIDQIAETIHQHWPLAEKKQDQQ